MKIVGLITEYNPFHNGHKYHIEQARKITGADAVVTIMSGNYVQRGVPSFVDKYTKTEVSLNNGVDLVIELPYCFACASAEYFATAAVTILDRLGCIDSLCFGAETDNISILTDIAAILADEPEKYKSLLKDFLKEGDSFPNARSKALLAYLCNDDLKNIINTPNNILAIEYLKCLLKRKSKINPVSIRRINAGYHDTDESTRFYSATAIRESTHVCGTLSDIDNLYMKNYEKTYPVTAGDYSSITGASLLQKIQNNSLSSVFGINQNLADRIVNNMDKYTDYLTFADRLKTKEISHTAILRGLLHCTLNITSDDMALYCSNDICNFIRILGFNDCGEKILSHISIKGNMAIISKMSDSSKILSDLTPADKKLFDGWLFADNIFRMVSAGKYNCIQPGEFARKLIRYK